MCVFVILFLFLYIAVLWVYKYLRIFKEASTNFWKYFYFYFYEYFCFYKLQISVIILTGPLSIWFVSMISIFILKFNHALDDCNRIWAHNHLVFKRKLSHLEKAAKTLLYLCFCTICQPLLCWKSFCVCFITHFHYESRINMNSQLKRAHGNKCCAWQQMLLKGKFFSNNSILNLLCKLKLVKFHW